MRDNNDNDDGECKTTWNKNAVQIINFQKTVSLCSVALSRSYLCVNFFFSYDRVEINLVID